MQAEVLSVGTELLLGQTVNTDTTIVAKALSALGIDLLYAAVVGDNVGRLEKAVYDALDRSDILITTGGLGPTGDDLTKETVAAAAGKKLVLHEQSYQHLLDYFANGGMTENQMKQAMLPEGCTALKNDNGTAPGCAFRTDKGKIVIMLPGPPLECEPLLRYRVRPLLAARGDAPTWAYRFSWRSTSRSLIFCSSTMRYWLRSLLQGLFPRCI